MRKIICVLLLALLPVVVFAGGPGNNGSVVPEPETLSLLGLGALGFLTTRLFKK